MDGILNRNIKLRIILQGRVDLLDEPLMQKMKEAGLRLLCCGFESGCQDVLDFYSKGTTVEENREVMRLADKNAVITYGNFILGAPIETREHVRKTIRFAMRNPLDACRFMTLYYTRGSRLWDDACEKGLIQPDEPTVLATRERALSNFTRRELEEICLQANQDFYRRPSLWARQLLKGIKIGREDPYLVTVLLGAILTACAQTVLARLSRIFTAAGRGLARGA
jgi:radical SAM superfamily enzyme YgiQ (UPF0313 family)